FPLVTYDHAFRRRDKILEATRARTMPPSKPVPGYGDLVVRPRLSADELATIRRWVEAGGSEGAAADLPPEKTFPVAASRGTPDFALPLPATFTVPAKGGDVYRCFSVPTSFKEDRYFTFS